jgi:1,4-alpha-glucan branching enzyme
MTKRSTNGEYEFRLNYPTAQEVVLVGDFEPCRESQVAMSRSPSGEWTCRLQLRDGVYHFKYWVDGNWCLDEESCATPAASFLTSTLVVHNEGSSSFAYLG